jgi:hypothetical protein
MIKDRIKDFRRVRAGDLSPSPRNWRTHPKAQVEALRGVLSEIGYADALLASELPDGTLEIVDGHARQALDPEQIVPVLVLDLDQAEAAKLMTVLDPLAAMAEANEAALESLLAEISTESEALQSMLDGLVKANGLGNDGTENDPNVEWQGMPEFDNPPKGYSQVIVHFKTKEDMDSFSSIIGCGISETTKFIWYPVQP